jgi:lipoyl-dependent peroxiredoxin
MEGASELRKVLYTAEATTEGGRDGRARTGDGRLEVELSVAGEAVEAAAA